VPWQGVGAWLVPLEPLQAGAWMGAAWGLVAGACQEPLLELSSEQALAWEAELLAAAAEVPWGGWANLAAAAQVPWGGWAHRAAAAGAEQPQAVPWVVMDHQVPQEGEGLAWELPWAASRGQGLRLAVDP